MLLSEMLVLGAIILAYSESMRAMLVASTCSLRVLAPQTRLYLIVSFIFYARIPSAFGSPSGNARALRAYRSSLIALCDCTNRLATERV